jgi:predicted hydrocarbon binding protein
MSSSEKMATNMAIRGAIDAMAEVMGKNGTEVLFRNAGLLHVFQNPPDYNFEPCIPTTEQIKFYMNMVDVMGLNGAITLWRRVAYTIMQYATERGHMLDSFKDLNELEKFHKGMEIFTMISGKGTPVSNNGRPDEMTVPDCFMCLEYKNTSKRGMCAVYEGAIQFLADWSFGKGKYLSRETKCMAKGDEVCHFALESALS